MSKRAAGILAVVLGLALSGCGDDGSTRSEGGLSTRSQRDSAGTTATDACAESGIIRCEAVALRFTEALSLRDVERVAAEGGGEVVALWRPDAVCVTDVSGQGPSVLPVSGGQRRSAFVYYRADAIVARQNEGPPATDGGWSAALRKRFVEEWQAATAGGVRFIGAALYLPDGVARGRPGVEVVGRLESYRVEGTDVLYLRGHDAAFGPIFPPPDEPAC